jgi:hypothetical protein
MSSAILTRKILDIHTEHICLTSVLKLIPMAEIPIGGLFTHGNGTVSLLTGVLAPGLDAQGTPQIEG